MLKTLFVFLQIFPKIRLVSEYTNREHYYEAEIYKPFRRSSVAAVSAVDGQPVDGTLRLNNSRFEIHFVEML